MSEQEGLQLPPMMAFTPSDLCGETSTRVGGQPAHFLTWWDAYAQVVAANGDRLAGLDQHIVNKLVAGDGWTISHRRGGWWRRIPGSRKALA